MAFESGAIANCFLDLADKENVGISPMKLIKLVYIVHGWHLAITDEPFFYEQVEDWKYGPVIDSLYHEFKDFGNRSITRRAQYFAHGRLFPHTLSFGDDADRAKTAVKAVWNAYKKCSATKLSSLTHMPGSPWDKTWNGEKGSQMRGTDIAPKLIRDHYSAILSADD